MSLLPPEPAAPTLPVTVERAIDAVCEAFEAAWQAGNRPDLAAFADQGHPTARPRLLRELVRIDAYYRQRAGDPPAADEYLRRFPALGSDGAGADTLIGEHPDHATVAEPPRVEGYDLLDEIGHGGMGVVYRARDLGLNRDVAVKVLPDRFPAASAAARRFLEEAQITGQLQHPGIPAVHQAGVTATGRPFLAMKLVKGRTLEAHLRERLHPSADRARLLAVFEQVCHAVGYAHSHGVVHRDIKPANVMVGAFSEVQVMDWGLAKVLTVSREAPPSTNATDAADEEPTAIHPTRSADEATQAGSLLGTPAYMPPEQAIGAVDQIDARSDVFGLGSVLCVLLTGKPPFVGESPESTRQLAARAKLEDAHARLDACGAEPELVALCKRCLAAEKADRPRDGGEVAAAVAGFRAAAEDRARRAELDRATARVQAAERWKRRRVQVALAVALAALVALTGFGLWFRDRQRADQAIERANRRMTTTQHATAALDLAESLLQQARPDDPDGMVRLVATARTAAGRADDILAGGEATPELAERAAAVRARVEAEGHHASLLAAVDKVRLEKSLVSMNTDSGPMLLARYAAAYSSHGIDPLGPRPDPAAVRDHPYRAHVRAGLLDWLSLAPAPARTQLRAFLDASRGSADALGPAWANAVRSRNQSAVRTALADQRLAAVPAAEWANAVTELAAWAPATLVRDGWRKAAEFHPDDFWVNFHFGLFLVWQPTVDVTEASRRLTAAVALRPHSPAAWDALGWNSYYKFGRREEGVRCLRRAVELAKTYWLPVNNLGCTLRDEGATADAVRCFETAIRCEPAAAPPYRNLGWMALHVTRPADPQKAEEMFRLAVPREAGNGDAIDGLVQALLKLGRVADAVAEAEDAAKAYPNSADVHLARARAYAAAGRDPADALRTADRLAPNRATALIRLTDHLLREGRDDELLAAAQQLARFTTSPEALTLRGKVLYRLKYTNEAVAAYQRALELDRGNFAAYVRLSDLLRRQNRRAELVAVWLQATERFPRDAATHAHLGEAYELLQDWVRAAAAYQKATQYNDQSADYHYRLGVVLRNAKQLGDAETELRRATELDPSLYPAHVYLGSVLRDRGDLDGAAAAYRTGIDLNLRQSWGPRQALAAVLATQEKYAEAWQTLETGLCEADWPATNRRTALGAAAGYAVRAGLGDGSDAPPPADRAGARERARELLRELLADSRALHKADPAGFAKTDLPQFNAILRNANLDRVQGDENLAKFPLGENLTWRALWTEWRVFSADVQSKVPRK